MTTVLRWLSEQPLHERPRWSAQRPPVAPTFSLDALDAATPSALAFTRATACSGTDYQGNVFQAASGEMTRQGLRRVQNLLTYSQTFSNAAWVKDYCTITANAYGTMSAIVENATAANVHRISQLSIAVTAGQTIILSCDVKAGARAYVQAAFTYTYFGVNGVYFNLSTGEVHSSTGVIDAGITHVGDGVYSFYVRILCTASGSTSVFINPSATGASSSFDGVNGQTALYVDKVQVQVARPGQTEPDEYVSTGVLASPYHGAYVDGVKYFDTDENGAKITGTGAGYDRDETGAWVRSSSVDPIEVGIPVVPAQTNRITYSSDLSNAAWTKRGACTATAGWDPQVGVYSRLAGLGATGVNDVYVYNTGYATSARVEPAFMLRTVSATGTMTLSMSGASGGVGTWTVNLALVSTTRFEVIDRFHPAVTIATEVVSGSGGSVLMQFIGTSGTLSVDVALVTQVEGERCYRPIYSAGSVTAANADAPSFTWTAFASNNEGSIVLDFVPLAYTGQAAPTYLSGLAACYKNQGSVTLYQYDGTNQSSFGDQVERGATKIAMAWQAGVGRTGYRDGVEKFADETYDGAWQSTTLSLNGALLLKSLQIYDYALTAEQLQGVSA